MWVFFLFQWFPITHRIKHKVLTKIKSKRGPLPLTPNLLSRSCSLTQSWSSFSIHQIHQAWTHPRAFALALSCPGRLFSTSSHRLLLHFTSLQRSRTVEHSNLGSLLSKIISTPLLPSNSLSCFLFLPITSLQMKISIYSF